MKTVDIIEKLLNQDLKNYPRAVLIEAADEIARLRKRVNDYSWQVNPDRMGS